MFVGLTLPERVTLEKGAWDGDQPEYFREPAVKCSVGAVAVRVIPLAVEPV